MEETERSVRTWMGSGREQEIDVTVSGIADGSTTLLNVVKALGEYLTSEEDELRTKGMEFLSEVLAKSPQDKLNRNAVRVLVGFYIGKLEDTETVVPALKGLAIMAPLPAFISNDTIEVFRALCAHVKMRALVQSVRYNVFRIIDSMVARHRDALKGLGGEFISGYIKLADGEKDPRNLMVAFAIARVVGVEFDISGHVEEFFNILFCYFPITFRPPPDDPYGITSEDLKERLRLSLSSNPAFGPMAVPLFIEKLNAGSPVTKRDTLQTLSVCMPVYGAAQMRSSSKKLWNSLRMEIFQPTDRITEEEALKTAQDLVKVIQSSTSDETAMQQDVDAFVKEVCAECLKLLGEPEKSQAIPATKVVNALLSTTRHVACYALEQVIPSLFQLFANPDEVANRSSTLSHLASIVEKTRDLANESDTPTTLITPYKDQALGILTTALKTRATALPALNGLRGLVETRDLLTEEEIGFVVHSVNAIVQEDEDDETSDSALDLLSVLSVKSSAHVSAQTFPALFSSLPDVAPGRDSNEERQRCWRVLAALRRLSTPAALFETLVIRLLAKVDLVIHASDEDDEPAAAYTHALLHTISTVLGKKTAAGDHDVPKYIDRLVPKLYELFIMSSGSGLRTTQVPRLVEVASEIITLVLETVPQSKQEAFYQNLFAGLTKGDIANLVSQPKLSNLALKGPLEVDAPFSIKATLPLYAAAVVPIRKETALPIEDISGFLLSLVLWSIHHAETDAQRSAAYHVTASILNRKIDSLAPTLDILQTSIWSEIISSIQQSPEVRRHAIGAWTWVTKALLVRNHPSGATFAQNLLRLFDDEVNDVAWAAGRAVGQIGGTDTVLVKRHHAIIKPLYAQKYCNLMLPQLVDGAGDTADDRRKTTSLVGLASLIKAVPRSIYEDRMPTLMPLLIRGLELPDPDVRVNVIDTLFASASSKEAANQEAKPEDRNVFAEHISTLIAATLKNSDAKSMSAVRVRVAALRLLGLLPSVVRYDVIHPHKNAVLRELVGALDDPKKVVRMEAVEARSKWFKASG